MKAPSKSKARAPRKPKHPDDDHVYCMLPAIGGASVFKEYRPDHRKSSLVVIRLERGEILTPEELADFPRELAFQPNKGGIVPDVFCWTTGPYIVTRQFREWLEELEPGRHAFHPIKVWSSRPIKGVTDHGTYYLILNPPEIDAIIPEGTIFWGGGTGPEEIRPDGSFALSSVGDSACYIKRQAVEGHHLWLLKGAGRQYMFSAELLRRYMMHKLRGLRIKNHCLLK